MRFIFQDFIQKVISDKMAQSPLDPVDQILNVLGFFGGFPLVQETPPHELVNYYISGSQSNSPRAILVRVKTNSISISTQYYTPLQVDTLNNATQATLPTLLK